MSPYSQWILNYAEKALDHRKVDKIRKEKNSKQIDVYYCDLATATSWDGINWEQSQQMKTHERFSRSLVWC